MYTFGQVLHFDPNVGLARHSCRQLLLNRGRHALSDVVDFVGKRPLLDNVSLGNWLDDVDVDQLSTAESRYTDVDQEHRLEQEVERHPVQKRTRPELNDVQECKHHPVGQELGVIRTGGSLQGHQRVVAGNNETSNVGQQLANTSDIQENQDEVCANGNKNGVRAGQPSLGLENVQGLETRSSLGLVEKLNH